jgi:hypothetical protein
VKEDYQKLLEMWRTEKARVKQLEDSLAMSLEINEKHQRYNGKLQIRLTEVEEDNKKLSKQVEDKDNVVSKLRSKGLL